MSILSTDRPTAKGRSDVAATNDPDDALSLLPDWRTAMKRAVRSRAELLARLGLPPAPPMVDQQPFPVFVPLEYLRRIEPGNDRDPLLLQVLPSSSEQVAVAGFSADPLAESDQTRAAGVIQKYAGRALLVTTGLCPVHCRYCFRRHFDYESLPQGRAAWSEALQQLRELTDVEEVLLSGGDPLSLGDDLLGWLVAELERLPHVRRLRVHSRFPIMIPQRVTDELVRLLRGSRLTTLLVVHANHANELDSYVVQALSRLVDGGIPVLNQAVLLRHVNDNCTTLARLSRALIESRVMPYYLHQLDRVAGAAHFHVPVAEGQRLVAQLRELLPGYAVPRYVCEQPGQPAKTVLL